MTRKLVYINVNTFPNEGFTSGLFITIREILQRSPAFGFDPRLVTLNYSSIHKTKIKSVMKNGLRIDYVYIPKNNEIDPSQTKQRLKDIFNEFRSSDVFICNTPAVFFDPFHLLVTQLLRERKYRVKVIFFDALFPKEHTQQTRRFRNEYKKILKTFDVYSVSKGIKRTAESLLQKYVKIFPNIYNVSLVKSSREISSRKYVTMINYAPN